MVVGELSVRTTPVGGDVVDVSSSGDIPNGRSQVVFFVHGYNNSYVEAKASYGQFITNLLKVGIGSFALPVFMCFWPGDTHIKVISTLSYPTELGPAKEAAKKFAAFLKTLQGPGGSPMDLDLVAHSLGNRLVLELLKILLAAPARGINLRSFTLMAAAVPVGRVDTSGDLRLSAQLPIRTLVLHSTGDAVLHFAFPAGETAAGDGFFPTAVGRRGGPSDFWPQHFPLDTFGHSDYWVKEESAQQALAMLQGSSTRSVATSVNAVHSLPAPNEIPSRDQLSRDLPERWSSLNIS